MAHLECLFVGVHRSARDGGRDYLDLELLEPNRLARANNGVVQYIRRIGTHCGTVCTNSARLSGKEQNNERQVCSSSLYVAH